MINNDERETTTMRISLKTWKELNLLKEKPTTELNEIVEMLITFYNNNKDIVDDSN